MDSPATAVDMLKRIVRERMTSYVAPTIMERPERLRQMYDGLSPKRRLLVETLADLEVGPGEASLTEVAKVLGVSPGAARKVKFDIVAKLGSDGVLGELVKMLQIEKRAAHERDVVCR